MRDRTKRCIGMSEDCDTKAPRFKTVSISLTHFRFVLGQYSYFLHQHPLFLSHVLHQCNGGGQGAAVEGAPG